MNPSKHSERGSRRIFVEEIMERLCVGKRAVYEMLERGEIPAMRQNRIWIIGRYQYEEWERTFGVRRTFGKSRLA